MKIFIRGLAVLVGLLLFIVPLAPAEDLIPEIKIGDSTTLKLSGYSQVFFIEHREPEEFYLQNFRLNIKLDFASRWGFYGQYNLPHIDDPASNWLRKSYLYYNFNNNWQLRVGRITSASTGSTPAPDKLETVVYPISEPFALYAWGALIASDLGNGWSMKADIAGNSGKPFDSGECWESLEFSGSLKKSFGKWLLLGMTQISEDFQRLGIYGNWRPVEEFFLKSGVYYSDRKNIDDFTGSYVLMACYPFNWFELHSQLDYRHIKDSDAILTNGIRIIGKDEQWSLSLDYETIIQGKREGRLLARINFYF